MLRALPIVSAGAAWPELHGSCDNFAAPQEPDRDPCLAG